MLPRQCRLRFGQLLLLVLLLLATGTLAFSRQQLKQQQQQSQNGTRVSRSHAYQRVWKAIDLILEQQNDLEMSGISSASRQTDRILNILYSVVQNDNENIDFGRRVAHARSSERRLEDGGDSNINDDQDDYFRNYYSYSSSDVSVSYDDEDNTVVTVGDDVIVVVEYSLRHYLLNGFLVMTCIVVGATMAGLLMGIMSLDPLILGVKARTADTEMERKCAMRLLPFVQNKNLVLVSVLLVNCGTNEALPIFMDALLENPLLTVILSLTVVLVVGEILPSAYFTGKDQIKSASQLLPILRFVIVVTSPISYPLAKLMDHYFHHGNEVSSFKRGEISAMVRIQYEEHLAWKRRQADALAASADRLRNKGASLNKNKESEGISSSGSMMVSSLNSMASFSKFELCSGEICQASQMCETLRCFNETDNLYACMPHEQCLPLANSKSDAGHQTLSKEDIVKLEGALSMRDKTVEKIYTPMNRVISVTTDTILDEDMMVRIYSYGYSRIPVLKASERFSHDNNSGDGNISASIGGQLSICGVLLSKQLMLVRKEDKRRVDHLTLYEPPCVAPDTTLADALTLILSGNRKSSNLALVCVNPGMAKSYLAERHAVPIEAGVLGIITLEQVSSL